MMKWIKDHSFIMFILAMLILMVVIEIVGYFFPEINSNGRLGVFQ